MHSRLLLPSLLYAAPCRWHSRAGRANVHLLGRVGFARQAVLQLTWLMAVAVAVAVAVAHAQTAIESGTDGARRFTVKAFHIERATLVSEWCLNGA